MRRAIATIATAALVLCVRAHVGVAGETSCEAPRPRQVCAAEAPLARSAESCPHRRGTKARSLATVPDAVVDTASSPTTGFVGSCNVTTRTCSGRTSATWARGVTTNLSTAGRGGVHMLGRENLYRGVRDDTCDVERASFDPTYPNDFRPLTVRVVGTERHEAGAWCTLLGSVVDGEGLRVRRARIRPSCGATKQVAQHARRPRDRGCGCGPGLGYCYATASATIGRILGSPASSSGSSWIGATSGKLPTPSSCSPTTWRRTARSPSGARTSRRRARPRPTTCRPGRRDHDGAVHRRHVAHRRAEQAHAGVVTLPGYSPLPDRSRAREPLRIAFQNRVRPAAKLDPQPGAPTTPRICDALQLPVLPLHAEPLAARQLRRGGLRAMNDPKVFRSSDPTA